MKLHRFQGHSSVTHHLYTVSCVQPVLLAWRSVCLTHVKVRTGPAGEEVVFPGCVTEGEEKGA